MLSGRLAHHRGDECDSQFCCNLYSVYFYFVFIMYLDNYDCVLDVVMMCFKESKPIVIHRPRRHKETRDKDSRYALNLRHENFLP